VDVAYKELMGKEAAWGLRGWPPAQSHDLPLTPSSIKPLPSLPQYQARAPADSPR
ncbi:hypothetical protein FRC11_014212, partial [Ceratobasidium sp. 423]